MSKSNSLSPREIIKELAVTGDGQVGDTGGKKQIRLLSSLLEGKNKLQQIEILKELYPNHVVWTKVEGVSTEKLPVA